MTADQILAPGLLAQPEQPLSVQVSVHGAQTVLHFNAPREYIAFSHLEPVVIATQMMCRAMEADDSTAPKVIELCMAIMDHAYAMRGDLKPAGGAAKHELIERLRKELTQRLTVVFNSTREKRTISNRSLARQVVEICFKAVFK